MNRRLLTWQKTISVYAICEMMRAPHNPASAYQALIQENTRMKMAISIGFVVAGLLVSSWVMDVYGTAAGLVIAVILGINYFFLMRKMR